VIKVARPAMSAIVTSKHLTEEERKNKIGIIEELNLKITKDFISNLNRIERNWDILKIAWKMKSNQQSHKLIEKQLQKYKSSTIKSDVEFDEIMFDFNNTILFPDFIDFTPNFSKYIREIFKNNNNREKNRRNIKKELLCY
jgi:hypothetical protein